MAEPAIPTDLADLGPEWLGTVFGAAVELVHVLDSHSGTTGRARLGVTWAPSAGQGLPASMFVKFAPFDAEQRGFVAANQMGVREARLYRDLALELPVRVPSQGSVALAADTAWEQYRLFAIYGWLAATATAAMGSKWQPEALALASTERATEALA